MQNYTSEYLSEKFLEHYKKIKPKFGFNGLGELTYIRTYSRIKQNGENESWWETVARVINGTFNLQKRWIEEHRLGWDKRKARKSAEEMYKRIFEMKFLPPGRGLWAMGTVLTEEKKLFACLNNCAYVSSENIKDDLSKSFCFLMDMSMLGVGVGFDVKGENKILIKGCNANHCINYQIPDTREGWVESVKLLIDSYFLGTPCIQFDYSLIRKAGEPIKGFGGLSSGHEPLKECHENIRKILNKNIGEPITITTIVDINNVIGKCVVAGNVRRTAEIVFGNPNSEEYLDLKNYKINQYREEFGWTSNNSIFAEVGMNYKKIVERTISNGEPGYVWLENMQGYSRMNNGKDYKDKKAGASNPCVSRGTLIAIKDIGYVTIDSVVNKEIEVWNGFEWSKVIPKITGKNQKMIMVNLDNGKYLKCTLYHKWYIQNDNGDRIEKKSKELKKGDKLFYFDDPIQPKIIGTHLLGIDGEVFCFDEPKRHTGYFNGIITGKCSEQTLESYEICNLVESFPNNHDSLEDYLITLKYAYLYAKTVTLGETHWPETNRVMLRNRRIGCSMSGIAQFITKYSLNTLKEWCEKGYETIEYYDEIYSDWLAIPKSIKKTSIKPSGTVSLLAGATPGMHYPEDKFYIRRIRLSKHSSLIEPLEKSGYKIEPCFGSEETTLVVEIPISIDDNIRTLNNVSMWEQLSLAAFLQKYWSDNQVSCTVTFSKEESQEIEYALNYFQYQLKGISFLPRLEKGAYKQMPYESISKEQFIEMSSKIKPLKLKKVIQEEAEIEKFCNNDTCLLK